MNDWECQSINGKVSRLLTRLRYIEMERLLQRRILRQVLLKSFVQGSAAPQPWPWKQICKVKCYLCGSQTETISDLFLHCPITDKLWQLVLNFAESNGPCLGIQGIFVVVGIGKVWTKQEIAGVIYNSSLYLVDDIESKELKMFRREAKIED